MRLAMLRGALVVGLLSVAAWACAEAPKNSVIVFILDCSKSMGELAVSEPGNRQVSDTPESTRMDAAQAILRKMLREVAAGGNCQAGLWLYGHRLVWEQDTTHPELYSQDDYLEATVGFEALNNLLPGDDVEQAQPIKPFTRLECTELFARLDVVKPWGEKPLYLTLTRALDTLGDNESTGPKCIVVLTDGGNEQWLARYKTNQARVQAVLRGSLVPIHFVHFGPQPEKEDPAEQQLVDLAEQSGGSVVHAKTSTGISLAELISSSRKVAMTPVSTEPAADGQEHAPPTAPPQRRNIFGSVVYYGKPVTSATISLEGTSIAPAKTDRQGRFLIRNVPVGAQYHVVVDAVARNYHREKSLDVTVEANGAEQPFLTIDVK